MVYRKAHKEDKAGIKDLLYSSFTRIYAYYAMKSFQTPKQTLVAFNSRKIIGVINWRIFKAGKTKIGYLYWTAVDKEHRRRGISRRLMHKAIQAIKSEAGPVDIYVATEKKNLVAKKFIIKSGFRKIEKAELKARFGKDLPALRWQMMLMSWEELFVMDLTPCPFPKGRG